MAVPTIAYLYASPPSSYCSTPYSTSYDFEVSSRSSSTTCSPVSTLQKPVVGGLSCLFSSSSSSSSSPVSVRHHAAGGGEDRGGGEMKELTSSYRYSPSNKFIGSSSSSLINRDQSPVSVFHGPVSCSGSSISSSVAARSPPIWNGRERTGNDLSIRGGSNGIFNGFVRNALLGSSSPSVDYDSPSFEVCKYFSFVDELLPFDMEDGFIESNPEPYAKDLLQNAQLRHKIFYEDVVIKAFYEADKAHRGQMRASGDPYLQHCVETAVLLALIGANSTVVAAGLLHDTLDDSFMGYDYILSTFRPGVADLVKSVSKLSHLSKLARENNTASKMVEADRLHTMFLAMVDARAVLIKLADRLHNMMTLDALPLEKGKRFAKETLEIFTPLANRLGISTWKEQLETLCFKHLYPEEHKDLSAKLMESFDEEMITSAIEKLERALKKKGVSYHLLSGRHKSLYSIYRKMSKKKLSTDEIHDIHGLRLIVEDEKDCYAALEVVHKLWSEIPGKLKDYINYPKFNGYQSLHTVVMDEKMFPLEVQIRTKEMHLQAEFGFAAHWRYKEGDCKHSSFVLQMVEWARWVVTWQCETMRKEQPSSIGFADSIRPNCKFPFHSEDCPYSYKPCSGHDEPVFVIVIENDKMSVQEFSANSTIVDLFERAGRGSSRWAHYGFPMKEDLRPRLNHEPVCDTKCRLKMGDVVELTPAIPDKSLTEYREEIQRMYNRGLTVSSPGPRAPTTMFSWR